MENQGKVVNMSNLSNLSQSHFKKCPCKLKQLHVLGCLCIPIYNSQEKKSMQLKSGIFKTVQTE